MSPSFYADYDYLICASLVNSHKVVQVAGMDPLRDEGIAYAKALEGQGSVFGFLLS